MKLISQLYVAIMLALFGITAASTPALMLGPSMAMAQDASPSPSPSVSPSAAATPKAVLVAQDAAKGVEAATEFLATKESIMTIVLGVLFALAKRVSNEKAGPIIGWIQAFFDGIAYLFTALGKLFKGLAELFAKALKSDGFLGKQ